MKLTKQILVLSRERYLIWLNSRSGSTSVRNMARYALGYDRPNANGGLTYLSHPMEVNLERYRSFKRLALIRNPYDRLISLWRHKNQRIVHKFDPAPKIKRKMVFHTWIRKVCQWRDWSEIDSHFWPCSIVLPTEDIKIVKIEGLPVGWPSDLPPLPHDNGQKKVDRRKLYSDQTANIVRVRYIVDVERFCYDF
jgi:hypothetical protein